MQLLLPYLNCPMKNRLIKVALVGKTNAGKSTLINAMVGEKISIINKKINTTQVSTLGIKNIKHNQIIFYDTPGSNFLKTIDTSQKKFKTNLWNAIENANIIFYIIDTLKYNFKNILEEITKLSEVRKKIIFIFNKIDLIENKKILPYINELKKISHISDFFLLSAKTNIGINDLLEFLISNTYESEWLYKVDEITNMNDYFIASECTRGSLLDFLHQEIPYNIIVNNNLIKYINKNNIKIKQTIEITNKRYKPIILGKKGESIKRIREKSQIELESVFNCKVHLYLQVVVNDKKIK